MASGGRSTVGTDVFAARLSEKLAVVVAAGYQAGLRVLAHALSAARHAIRASADGIEQLICLTVTGPPEVSESRWRPSPPRDDHTTAIPFVHINERAHRSSRRHPYAHRLGPLTTDAAHALGMLPWQAEEILATGLDDLLAVETTNDDAGCAGVYTRGRS